MWIEIKIEKLIEIAECLDAGMVCFYNKTNGELETYPYGVADLALEHDWAEVKGKIKSFPDRYFQIEKMQKHEMFELVKKFVNEINDISTRKKFIGIISAKKTFTHFENILVNYPDLRQQWFAFKLERYIEFVKRQVDIHHVLNDAIKGFYIHLEYHLSRTFQNSNDMEVRRFWCDGVDVPADSSLSKQNDLKAKRIETQAWIGLGVTFQEKYEMIIKLGPDAIKKYSDDRSMIDCLPDEESLDWVTVDKELKKIELQLN